MTAITIELPHQVIDLLTEAGDELEVVHDQLSDDPSVEIDLDENLSWYFTIVRDQAGEVLQWIEQIEDQLLYRSTG